jgi:hypothetical protein
LLTLYIKIRDNLTNTFLDLESFFKSGKSCQAWWCMPITPALRRLKQVEQKFQASLEYIMRPYRKQGIKIKTHNKSNNRSGK